MTEATYLRKRDELETYFDRTAAEAWAKLTSDAPVSGIRATVRAGRDEMRRTLLDWLPADLTGARILDAGCGAGQFAVEAARRGADVTAVDLSETLIDLAKARAEAEAGPGRIAFRVGDMFDPSFGVFDHVVAMDSIIHYALGDMARILEGFSSRANRSIFVTFAPRTPLLSAVHLAGKLFPRGDRSPAINPVNETALRRRLAAAPGLRDWTAVRTRRIASGFYISQALEVARR